MNRWSRFPPVRAQRKVPTVPVALVRPRYADILGVFSALNCFLHVELGGQDVIQRKRKEVIAARDTQYTCSTYRKHPTQTIVRRN